MDKWEKIRDHEIDAGKVKGKLKEKILDKEEMLKIGN